ncbi:MAG: molybdopterin-dependent oxidoreductase [Burkholderiales bacterium]|nr:molybdopterin-dependent oxidoreductase [Burkholderiales bacterium]
MTIYPKGFAPHSSHWGLFGAKWQDGALSVLPHPRDPDPNPLIENLPAALHHPVRVTRPMIRRGWLERGPGPDDARTRGDAYVAMDWDEALDRVAAELRRVRDAHGPQAIFGGSYGWSSAGRFHHAQSQLHRFLNTALGGYVRSVNSYSAGASMVILPHILGSLEQVTRRNVTWEQVALDSEIVLAFGGMALKNSRVAAGGVSQHVEHAAMRRAAARGCRFISISPLRDDLPEDIGAQWIAPRPGTDTALMLGLLHTLVAAGRHDAVFLESHCVGWGEFQAYLEGRSDGTPKSAAWAAAICGLAESEIVTLAQALAGRRALIVVAHALQRAEHGEQPVWMGAVLAAALGQIGLAGGGFAYALGTLAHYGRRSNTIQVPSLPQGSNGVRDFIPVARIADMLLHPGAPFEYNGETRRYPDVRLAYWAGGNPFHHHQDLARLERGFARLDTFIVHESAWTASARRADIVLPCTLTIERDDIGGGPTDPLLVAMHRALAPHGQARDDYEIFAALAERLGRKAEFTEGRSSAEWLRHLYAQVHAGLAAAGAVAPDFDAFWERGEIEMPQHPDDGGLMRAFRRDPLAHPLPTPGGKVQIVSARVKGFGYADCPGHPAWLPPVDVPTDRHPLYLVANQPATRLHSQLDFGGFSAAAKRDGREVVTVHPADAAARGIQDGDIVRLFNDRGACLASAHLSEGIRAGVVQLPTGAWYDPQDAGDGQVTCVHGNPNVLTRDHGTSSLAQGSTGQLTTVQLERYAGNVPTITVFSPPTP